MRAHPAVRRQLRQAFEPRTPVLVFASLARIAVALTIGVGLLRDDQVLRDLWLLPLRDLFGLLFWFWSFAGDTVVWRGTTFHLQNGRIHRV